MTYLIYFDIKRYYIITRRHYLLIYYCCELIAWLARHATPLPPRYAVSHSAIPGHCSRQACRCHGSYWLCYWLHVIHDKPVIYYTIILFSKLSGTYCRREFHYHTTSIIGLTVNIRAHAGPGQSLRRHWAAASQPHSAPITAAEEGILLHNTSVIYVVNVTLAAGLLLRISFNIIGFLAASHAGAIGELILVYEKLISLHYTRKPSESSLICIFILPILPLAQSAVTSRQSISFGARQGLSSRHHAGSAFIITDIKEYQSLPAANIASLQSWIAASRSFHGLPTRPSCFIAGQLATRKYRPAGHSHTARRSIFITIALVWAIIEHIISIDMVNIYWLFAFDIYCREFRLTYFAFDY